MCAFIPRLQQEVNLVPWAHLGNAQVILVLSSPKCWQLNRGQERPRGPDIARGRRWHRAESLHADFHTRADLRARHRDLCPKRLQDLQLCWLSSPWEGSWKAFSAKSCLACVLAAEWVRFNLKRHLGFKTYPQIQE